MPGSQQNAVVDQLLTDISNKITPKGMIAEQVLPMVKVKKSSAKIGQYGTSHLRISTTLTTGKNKYPQIDTRVYSTTSYDVESHGLSDIITERDKANVQDPFDAEVDTTDELTTILMLDKEKGLADSLGDTSVITQNVTLSGTDQYDDYTNSDPIGDFSTARTTIRSAVGITPDTAIMNWTVWNKLRYHDKILASLGFKDNRPGGLTLQELASAMEVERILIGSAVYNSAKQGQTDSITDVWGNNIIFGVLPVSAGKRQVSLGYRFQQFADSKRVFKNSVDNPPNATEVIVDDHYDQLISQTGAGYLIKDAV